MGGTRRLGQRCPWHHDSWRSWRPWRFICRFWHGRDRVLKISRASGFPARGTMTLGVLGDLGGLFVDSGSGEHALLIVVFDFAHLGHEVCALEYFGASAAASQDQFHVRWLLVDELIEIFDRE